MYILKQKQYAVDYSRYYGEGENRGMSTGAKVGLGLGTVAAGAGAIAAGRRGFLGAKAMRGINSGWAKVGRAVGNDAMIMSGSRGVAAAEAMGRGQINRRGADLLRQGNLTEISKSKNLAGDFGIKDANTFNTLRQQVRNDATAWRGKHNNMQTVYDKRITTSTSQKPATNVVETAKKEDSKLQNITKEQLEESNKAADSAKEVAVSETVGQTSAADAKRDAELQKQAAASKLTAEESAEVKKAQQQRNKQIKAYDKAMASIDKTYKDELAKATTKEEKQAAMRKRSAAINKLGVRPS